MTHNCLILCLAGAHLNNNKVGRIAHLVHLIDWRAPQKSLTLRNSCSTIALQPNEAPRDGCGQTSKRRRTWAQGCMVYGYTHLSDRRYIYLLALPKWDHIHKAREILVLRGNSFSSFS
eukprot:GHVS01006676.1.p1 GENE.GHVS01006676.1~~GHVS01006676.1.p1  ORF type:complete len:118 (+),score=1.75 GHVS01006676.1:729-1082(+)